MPDGNQLPGHTDLDRQSTKAQKRHGRRLSDKLFISFDQACDQKDLEVAERLLRLITTVIERAPEAPDRRKNRESVVAAYQHLWMLRHPEVNEAYAP